MEIAIRDFESLEINFTRADVQSFTIGEDEFNVTLTDNNETNKYLAIYKANYPNNPVTKIFHFRKTVDHYPDENQANNTPDSNEIQNNSIKILPIIIIIGSILLLILILAFITVRCIRKKQKKPRNQETVGKIGVFEKAHPKPAGDIHLYNYQFENQNYENYE